MTMFEASAPVLRVKDYPASVSYWRDNLGFLVVGEYGEPKSFAILHRDRIHLMLKGVSPQEEIVPYWSLPEPTCNAYFWVTDATTLFAEYEAAGARVEYPPELQPYGVLEFAIRDLDDQVILFGEVVED